MKQDISMIRGTTNTFNIELKDEYGGFYELQNGSILRFGVKNRADQDEYVLKKRNDFS